LGRTEIAGETDDGILYNGSNQMKNHNELKATNLEINLAALTICDTALVENLEQYHSNILRVFPASLRYEWKNV
jgi:hypothetical protein